MLHPWLKRELTAILATLPQPPAGGDPAALRAAWERWQAGLAVKPTLAEELPPLRMLLVMDNLTGHRTPELVLWLFAHGIMPLYTPLSGSWLNMAELELSALGRQCLGRRIADRDTLATEVVAWEAARNEQRATINWGFTVDQARTKLHRLYPS